MKAAGEAYGAWDSADPALDDLMEDLMIVLQDIRVEKEG